jgi:AraC-like DNA-binding protein
MIDQLAKALFQFTERHVGESPYMTAIETMVILRSDHPKPPVHRLAQPALCIVAQGAKWATFGANRLEYRAGQALVIGVETPSIGRVFEARPGEPCLVLTLGLDLAILRSVAEGLDPPPKPCGEAGRGVFVADVEGPLTDCALRLVRLLDTPKAIATLYPVIMREICYWLLVGPQGSEVARLALANSPSQNVIAAMHSLRDRFREPIRIEALAKIAQMSPSTFHRQFKALTLLSPLQYQKQLRLLEARRLMISTGVKVETAAFEVGYESPSQFSREYARMFGAPPKRDVNQLQSATRENPRPEMAQLAA